MTRSLSTGSILFFKACLFSLICRILQTKVHRMLLLTFCSIEKKKKKIQDTFYDIETLYEKGPLRDGCITQDECPNVFSFLLDHTTLPKVGTPKYIQLEQHPS